jgi:hypothetical protein
LERSNENGFAGNCLRRGNIERCICKKGCKQKQGAARSFLKEKPYQFFPDMCAGRNQFVVVLYMASSQVKLSESADEHRKYQGVYYMLREAWKAGIKDG